MKILRLLLILVVLLVAGIAVALAVTTPEPIREGTESAARLAPGPHAVDQREVTWVDETRRTNSNGEYAGAEERSYAVTIWAPADAPGPHPLLVYSHGFMSNRHEAAYLAEHMASFGYVFVATDYPLTHFDAPGGPNADDVVHQPADVTFLIDRVLALDRNERAFEGGIDRSRIGVLGLSLGGLTTTLAAFHPALGDPRISAAASIAGPSVMFGPRYFERQGVPFLMIAGTHDAMIHYDSNGAPVPDLISAGGLLTIEGASHAGFSAMAAGPMRLLGNPDNLGCNALLANLEIAEGENPFDELTDPSVGMVDASGSPIPCQITFDEAMHPGRQHMLTTLAIRAFFESHFADDALDRAAHAAFLEKTLPGEIGELSFEAARKS